ncbi:MAG TPA: cobyrinic acid a,c-diamide synthase [Chloroflexi bacterium]|nr:cobyrinic acid a,c-diamide synthase [Chloroflexota bacterium]HHW87253.1 ParA family protein [Chloroflexota bacterium]
MTTIALYSNKGGVGKTAAAVNLAYLAAAGGASTLLCDLDAQGSSTYYFRVQPGIKRKARGLVKGNRELLDSVKATDYAGLDLLPADFSHRRLDLEYAERKKPTAQLAKALEPLQSEYDVVVLDCPPTINLLAENVFMSADVLLTPLIPTSLSLLAHRQLLAFLGEHDYRRARVYAFFSMADVRKRLHRDLMIDARASLPNVLQTAIPYLAAVEQMGVHRAPIYAFAANTPAATAYRDLWAEVRALIKL